MFIFIHQPREESIKNLKCLKWPKADPPCFRSLHIMDTDNPQLVTFLQGIRPQLPLEIQPKIDDLVVYYQKK